MKKYPLLPARAIIIAGLLTSLGSANAQQVTVPLKLQKYVRANALPEHIKLPPGLNLLQRKIDLSAESINFSVIKTIDKFNAVVKIEAVVKNTGRSPYVSGANQQSALLYEDNGGVMRLVASQSFQNLDVNATVKVSFTRNWNKASPAEGEFPPNYILVIGFDPDIYIDGNDNNDDVNNANNRLTKSSGEINAFSFKK